MNTNKMPGEPEEPDYRAMEKELIKVKRSNLILSIGLLLQGILYGVLIFQLILRTNRIIDIVRYLMCLS